MGQWSPKNDEERFLKDYLINITSIYNEEHNIYLEWKSVRPMYSVPYEVRHRSKFDRENWEPVLPNVIADLLLKNYLMQELLL